MTDTEYPRQLIWDQVRVERDWRIMAAALDDLCNIEDQPARAKNSKAYEKFIDDAMTALLDQGVKPMQKGKGVFVPRRTATNLDGYIRHARVGADIALVIPFLDAENNWRIIAVECISVQSSRGRGYICLSEDLAAWKKTSFYHKSDALWFVRDHAIRRCVDRSPIKNYEAALGTILWAILKAKRKEGLPMRLLCHRYVDGVLKTQEVKASNAVYESFGNIIGTRFVVYREGKARAASERKAFVLVTTWLSQDMNTTPNDLSRTANDSYLTISESMYNNHVQNLDGHCTSCGNTTYGRVNINATNLKCSVCGRNSLHGMEALRAQGLIIFSDNVHAQYEKKFGELK